MTTKEIEETEIEEETVTTQDKKEKQFSQEEVNKLLAKERRESKSRFDAMKEEYDSFRADIETKESARTEKQRKYLETLKKDLPEQLVKLLDKLSVEEQLETLEDEEFLKAIPEKRRIPETPEGRERDSKPIQSPLSINLR